MNKKYIENFSKDTEIAEVLMVKEIDVKLARNNKPYLHIILGDKTGEIVGRKWDMSETEINAAKNCESGKLLWISGSIKDWNGGVQLNITAIKALPDNFDIDINEFVKAAPEKPEEMYQYVMGRIEAFEDEDLKALCKKVWTDRKKELLYYPAASKNHHAVMGGLLYHMKTMGMTGEKICEVYKGLNKDLLLTGVFLHDIEKITEIDSNQYGIAEKYSFEGQMLGHIIQGIMFLEKEMEVLGFSKEKKVMIEHMILSHHYEPEYGSPKKPLFPEAEILHYLDMIDARMYDMFNVLKETEEGEFSTGVRTLENRRLYNRSKGANMLV